MVTILSVLDSRIGRLCGLAAKFASREESSHSSNQRLLSTIEDGLILKKILRDKYSLNVQLDLEVFEQIRGFMGDSGEMFDVSCSLFGGEWRESIPDIQDEKELILRYTSELLCSSYNLE